MSKKNCNSYEAFKSTGKMKLFLQLPWKIVLGVISGNYLYL